MAVVLVLSLSILMAIFQVDRG